MNPSVVIIFITCANNKEAKQIATSLVKNRLVACANLVPNIDSVFWWQGKVDNAKEALLIIKTKKIFVNKLIRKVKSLHSYEVPEIIALPIIAGNKEYLEWIDESTG